MALKKSTVRKPAVRRGGVSGSRMKGTPRARRDRALGAFLGMKGKPKRRGGTK